MWKSRTASAAAHATPRPLGARGLTGPVTVESDGLLVPLVFVAVDWDQRARITNVVLAGALVCPASAAVS